MVKYTQQEVDEIKAGYDKHIEKLAKEIADLHMTIVDSEVPKLITQVEVIPGETPCSELLVTAQENALELASTFEKKLALREEAITDLENRLEGLKDLEQVESLLEQKKMLQENMEAMNQGNNDLMEDNKIKSDQILQLKTDLELSQLEVLRITQRYDKLRSELHDLLTK